MRENLFFLVWLISVSAYSQHHHETTIEKNIPQVVLFMAIDCPITQKYLASIKEIAAQFSNKEVRITGYFPAGLTRKEEAAFRLEYQIPKLIEFVDDKKHVWTEKLHAKVTPEVFVISNNQVVYKGAIDNWFYELGRYRLKITEHYLIDAINAALNGTKPDIGETEAVGCSIQLATKTKGADHIHNHQP